MARNILTIRELGAEACWLLVQQAMGIPDTRMQSDFMKEKVALLLFRREAFPERLCVTAAFRQMGGTTIYVGDDGNWQTEMKSFQTSLIPIFSYYIDCAYTYGYSIYDLTISENTFPIINTGSPEAQPAHALADVACMMRREPKLAGVKACWIGCVNGALHSLMECAAIFHFELVIALPPNVEDEGLVKRAAELNCGVSFVKNPEEAIKDARFVYAGRRTQLCSGEETKWALTQELFKKAKENARLFLSASPLRAIPIDPVILASKASMLTRQAEYRLRVHKRMLHWVFVK